MGEVRAPGVSAAKSAARALWSFGPMRVALLCFAFASVLFAPRPGAVAGIAGWGVVSNVLAPVLAPLIFMALALDTLMALLFMTDKAGEARRRYRRIALVDAGAALVLLLFWLPYFIRLIR